jgi:hypothetical protein
MDAAETRSACGQATDEECIRRPLRHLHPHDRSCHRRRHHR